MNRYAIFAPLTVLLFGCSGANPTLQPPDELVIERVELLQAESWPVQVRLELTGSLPSPCHELSYAVTLPSADGLIVVDAAAEPVQGANCAREATPFRQTIGLGSYTGGEFEVILNGQSVSGFSLEPSVTAPDQPVDPSGSARGPVYVDEATLALLESFPVQVELLLRGSLPTPCATLEWTVEDPDEQGRILVEIYSLTDPVVDCIQVLQEFEAQIPLGSFTEGKYSVWLNGEQMGDFEP